MFKSKHSGWTWDLKRTPFGGGGGFNPLDAVSSALGTDGGDGGLLGGLADIDPGPAIGQGLAELDETVGREIPGGWTTVGAAAAAATGLYFAPELLAALGAEGVAGSQATFMAADAANLAAQGLSQSAIAQNLAVGYGISEAAAASAAAAAAGTVGEFGASAVTQALPYSETFDAWNLAQQGLSSSAIEQNLVGTGLNNFLAADMANMAASGLSPEAIAQNLAYSYNPTELAGTGIESLQAQSGMSATDVLKNVNRAKKIADVLNQGGTGAGKNISVNKIPTANQWSQQAAQNFAQATPEQFGGLYNMNQNPFTFQNPLASALAGKEKQAGIYDVSGTQGQALNTQNQTANLLRMFG
jgi:hypothetical protein